MDITVIQRFTKVVQLHISVPETKPKSYNINSSKAFVTCKILKDMLEQFNS